MLDWFNSLTVTDKVMVVGFFTLGVILVTLWAMFIAKRHDAKELPADTLPFHKDSIENCKDATSSHYEDENQQKPKKRCVIWSFLGKCLNSVKEDHIRYPPDDKGDNQNQPSGRCHPSRTILMGFSQSHIRIIVNWLRRIVNHSGKEPN